MAAGGSTASHRCCRALWELEGRDLSVSLWLLRAAPTLLPAGSGLLLFCRQRHRCPSCCGKRPWGGAYLQMPEASWLQLWLKEDRTHRR